MSKKLTFIPYPHLAKEGNYGVYSFNGVPHREDGPAVIWPNRKAWHLLGKLHREDGPAEIVKLMFSDTTKKSWYVNGLLHRKGGPAVIETDKNGNVISEQWYVNGLLHRKNGPAIIRHDRHTEDWFEKGVLTKSIPCSKWADPNVAKAKINFYLRDVEKEDGRYVFYKSTLISGNPPLNKPKCGCPNIFDYQVGYVYTEPHADHDFYKLCGAGINVCATKAQALIYSIHRVVKVLVKKRDIVFASRDKWRVKEVEVVEEFGLNGSVRY